MALKNNEKAFSQKRLRVECQSSKSRSQEKIRAKSKTRFQDSTKKSTAAGQKVEDRLINNYSKHQRKLQDIRESETDGLFTPKSYTKGYRSKNPQLLSRPSLKDQVGKTKCFVRSKTVQNHRSSPEISSKRITYRNRNMSQTPLHDRDSLNLSVVLMSKEQGQGAVSAEAIDSSATTRIKSKPQARVIENDNNNASLKAKSAKEKSNNSLILTKTSTTVKPWKKSQAALKPQVQSQVFCNSNNIAEKSKSRSISQRNRNPSATASSKRNLNFQKSKNRNNTQVGTDLSKEEDLVEEFEKGLKLLFNSKSQQQVQRMQPQVVDQEQKPKQKPQTGNQKTKLTGIKTNLQLLDQMIEEEGLDVFEAPNQNLRRSKDSTQNKFPIQEKRRHSFRRKSTITTNSDDRFFDSFIDNEFTLIEQNSKDSIGFEDADELAPEAPSKIIVQTKKSRKVKFDGLEEATILQELAASSNIIKTTTKGDYKTKRKISGQIVLSSDGAGENFTSAKKYDLVPDLADYESTSFCSNRPLTFSSVSESMGSTLNSLVKSKVQSLFKRDHISQKQKQKLDNQLHF